jgi:hypothetical protein
MKMCGCPRLPVLLTAWQVLPAIKMRAGGAVKVGRSYLTLRWRSRLHMLLTVDPCCMLRLPTCGCGHIQATSLSLLHKTTLSSPVLHLKAVVDARCPVQ